MQKYIVKIEDNGAVCWFDFETKKYHRKDGPAYELLDGYKAWYIDGKLHRTDGPAVEWPDGRKQWYIDGTRYTEEEFNKRINSCEGKTVEIDGKKYKLTLCE